MHNIAADCGVSSPTIREYFQILEDTLLARFVPSYQKRPKRRVIQAPKFYFFDVAVVGHLLKRGPVAPGSESFGKAFEHFIFQELWAHRHYSALDYPLSYWRTASQFEVDFVLGDHQIAVEVKSTDNAAPHHTRGLKAFAQEYKAKELILVSLDPRPRRLDGITVLPWKRFLDRLWAGELIR